jgi:hypothetical protein
MNTPETDHLESNLGNAAHPVLSSFCRKLERERDEWKALATQYSGEREHNAMQALAYKAERDEWESKYIQQNKDLGCEMMDPNGTIWDHAKTLQRERDEARGQRDMLAGALQKVSTSWNFVEVAREALQSLTPNEKP